LLTFEQAAGLNAQELRAAIRRREWTEETVGLALGHLQLNLAVVPKSKAYDMLLFCTRNPAPCPVLEVTEPGSPLLRTLAKGADLRTDIPKYRVYKHGELVAETTDITEWWRDDFVGFLLGCSLTFENAMLKAGLPLRHLEANTRIPVYISGIECEPAGEFSGPMVVSMRPIPAHLVPRAVQVTTRYARAHGAPIHIGDPAAIGIKDLDRVDFGDPPVMRPGDVPCFWACGITPQAVAMRVKPDILISHAPEHMFVSDLRDEEIATL
jgi:uncharacterized protein YcsI (UPF0317 family)